MELLENTDFTDYKLKPDARMVHLKLYISLKMPPQSTKICDNLPHAMLTVAKIS